MIFAIDPGNEQSAYVLIDDDLELIYQDKLRNDFVLFFIEHVEKEVKSNQRELITAIEMPACYGMAVGRTVFDTCRWVGRFQQAMENEPYLVYRKATNKDTGMPGVCMNICKMNTAKDKNIRQAIIDRYEPTGGGKIPQIGIKSKPGPLFGVSADIWAALAVALTVKDFLENK